MFIPSVLLIERYGMKISMILSVSLSLIGSWIALKVDNWPGKIIGQLLIDAGFPFMVGCVTKLSAAWFPSNERFYATSFSILGGLIGYAFGDASISIYERNPTPYAITLSVLFGVLFVSLVFLFSNKPENYPSYSQARKQYVKFDIKKDLKEMVSNRPFLFSCIASSLFMAYLVDISKGLSNVVTIGNLDLTDDIDGITIFFFVPGFFSALLPAYYLSSGVVQYRGVFCVIQVINMFSLSLLIIAIAFAIDYKNFLFAMTTINGFAANACLPLCYEILAETGFPKSEALTAGFLHALYSIMRIVLKGMNRLLDEDNIGF
jgi:Na+/melibiose symporter-like transporter